MSSRIFNHLKFKVQPFRSPFGVPSRLLDKLRVCARVLFIITNVADGTYTSSGWGLLTQSRCMQSGGIGPSSIVNKISLPPPFFCLWAQFINPAIRVRDDKNDTYMILIQSSKEQHLDECNGQRTEKEDSNVSFIFYYIVNNQLYSMSSFSP
jgi:hypothetical protein